MTLETFFRRRPRIAARFRASVAASGPVSGKHRQFLANLQGEQHLGEAQWGEVVRAVIARPAAVDHALESCRLVFRALLARATRPLGPEASDLPHHRLIGRAVGRPQFASYLKATCGGSREANERIIRNLIDREPEDLLPEWRRVPLGQWLMWATFSESPTSPDPFTSLPAAPTKARCVLGMPPDTGRLLLFIYELPETVSAHVPTVAEAYAGDSWNVFFRTSLPGDGAGRTMTRDDCEGDMTMPEIVHLPVSVDALRESLRLL